MQRTGISAFLATASLLLASCGGGGGGTSGGSGGSTGGSSGGSNPTIRGFTIPAQEALTVEDVGKILAQAIEEAQARSKPATIAVVDRVGNVLALYRMAGSPERLVIQSPPERGAVIPTDLEGFRLPGDPQVGIPGAVPAGALAKAITGAYLSSAGNAFSTRVASQIVQEHFPAGPSTTGLESGPLFGVQFSSLPCSDLTRRFDASGGAAAFIGPKRSPIGLSADPGGIPLYKNGVVVGGIGVMSDGLYSYDRNTLDIETDPDEYIALAGSTGFEAPTAIRADRITVDGTTLRFSDANPSALMKQPSQARSFAALNVPATGSLIALNGYYAGGAIVAGRPYGSEGSGYRRTTAAEFSNPDAYVLTDGSGNNRYPIRGGTDGAEVAQPLTAAEARAILEEAFRVMSRTRAQIRTPLDSPAEVTLSLVDSRGQILGIVRAPDAPVFGTDVSLQKARTAAFFSNSRAGAILLADPNRDVKDFVPATQAFFNDPNVLAGKYAFTDRIVGLLSRPYFPDGEVGKPNGPFSRPFDRWSPFSTGLQTALITNSVVSHVAFVLGLSPTDVPQHCTGDPNTAAANDRIANGIQIFPGSEPIYRGNTLVGALGMSGDGIDQDDMISFLGIFNAGARVGGFGHADPAIRASSIPFAAAGNGFLPYVQCPFAPFLDTNDQNVCQGK